MLLLMFLLPCVAAMGQGGGTKSLDKAEFPAGELPDFTFSLTPLPENPGRYSLVLSDSDEHVISGSFSIFQLQVLRAILDEAQKFAYTEEAVGTKEPITTRFLDKQEQGFTVDVQKFGNQSRLYLTIHAGGSGQTAEAGRVNRSVRRAVGFLFDLAARVESVLPKSSK
jgi:hypothetical protein